MKLKADAEHDEHMRQLEAARAKAEADRIAAQAKPVPQAAPVVVTAPGTTNLSPDAETKARESMRQTLAALDAQQKNTAPATVTPQPKVKGKVTFTPTVTEPIATPPPAPLVPGSKEQRLADLLNRYKMDQITPGEYHEQKAKILAEP